MEHTRADRRRAEINLPVVPNENPSVIRQEHEKGCVPPLRVHHEVVPAVALLDGDQFALQMLRLHEHDESDEYTAVREKLATDANLGTDRLATTRENQRESAPAMFSVTPSHR